LVVGRMQPRLSGRTIACVQMVTAPSWPQAQSILRVISPGAKKGISTRPAVIPDARFAASAPPLRPPTTSLFLHSSPRWSGTHASEPGVLRRRRTPGCAPSRRSHPQHSRAPVTGNSAPDPPAARAGRPCLAACRRGGGNALHPAIPMAPGPPGRLRASAGRVRLPLRRDTSTEHPLAGGRTIDPTTP